jgi:hypothetical protein
MNLIQYDFHASLSIHGLPSRDPPISSLRAKHTFSILIYVVYNFWSNSNLVMFDQVFSKIYELFTIPNQ